MVEKKDRTRSWVQGVSRFVLAGARRERKRRPEKRELTATCQRCRSLRSASKIVRSLTHRPGHGLPGSCACSSLAERHSKFGSASSAYVLTHLWSVCDISHQISTVSGSTAKTGPWDAEETSRLLQHTSFTEPNCWDEIYPRLQTTRTLENVKSQLYSYKLRYYHPEGKNSAVRLLCGSSDVREPTVTRSFGSSPDPLIIGELGAL